MPDRGAPLKHKYIARDQFGNVEWIERAPRRTLAARYPGRVEKMYIGDGRHVGYVVGQHWFEVMRLEPLHTP